MGRINKRIERLEVLEPCLKLCKQLLGTHVLEYKRLDALDSYHISGSPDIEIKVSKDNMVWIIQCECKKPEGGVLGESQIKYRDKYKVFKNIIYAEITDVLKLKELILTTSDYGCEKLQEFNDIKEL